MTRRLSASRRGLFRVRRWRVLTPEKRERACRDYAESMPGSVQLHLAAGDFAVYRNSLWHLGNYVPYAKRATLHDFADTPAFAAYRERIGVEMDQRKARGGRRGNGHRFGRQALPGRRTLLGGASECRWPGLLEIEPVPGVAPFDFREVHVFHILPDRIAGEGVVGRGGSEAVLHRVVVDVVQARIEAARVRQALVPVLEQDYAARSVILPVPGDRGEAVNGADERGDVGSVAFGRLEDAVVMVGKRNPGTSAQPRWPQANRSASMTCRRLSGPSM